MYRNSIRDVPSRSFVLGIFENVAKSMNEINRKIIPSINKNKKRSNWKDVYSISEGGIFLNSKLVDKSW